MRASGQSGARGGAEGPGRDSPALCTQEGAWRQGLDSGEAGEAGEAPASGTTWKEDTNSMISRNYISKNQNECQRIMINKRSNPELKTGCFFKTLHPWSNLPISQSPCGWHVRADDAAHTDGPRGFYT